MSSLWILFQPARFGGFLSAGPCLFVLFLFSSGMTEVQSSKSFPFYTPDEGSSSYYLECKPDSIHPDSKPGDEYYRRFFSKERKLSFYEARAALFDLVAEKNSNWYETATGRFLDALHPFEPDSLSLIALDEEAQFLALLLPSDSAEDLNLLRHGDSGLLAKKVRKVWTELDPLPAEMTHPRLLEHIQRIRKARELYPDSLSGYLTDARGLLYIRYGPPDRVLDNPLQFNRGEIQGFVTDFALNREGGSLSGRDATLGGVHQPSESNALNRDAAALMRMAQSSLEREAGQLEYSRVTDELIETIYRNPFQSSLKIWIYHQFTPEMQNNLIFYFTSDGPEGYREVEALDNWFPSALYTPSSRGYDADFAPALPLQFLAYQRLMFEDRTFLDRYSELENRIFHSATERSTAELLRLSSTLRHRNEQISQRIRGNSPPLRSEELTTILKIPLEITQYRSLNKNDEPVFISFIESYPLAPFLIDFGRNEELFSEEEEEDMIVSAISEWYSIEQGVELFDTERVRKGRIRNSPSIYVSEEQELPSRLIAEIPFLETGALQTFYVTLKNRHPDASENGTAFLGREIRAMGNISREQETHQLCEGASLCMGDLITGSAGNLWPGTRFPFLVSHERKISAGKTPVFHFELFHLSTDREGFSSFEIEYLFEPVTQRARSLFRRQSKPVTGRLQFRGPGSQFRESLEFDNLNLREGRYRLSWNVTDLLNQTVLKRELFFEVVEDK